MKDRVSLGKHLDRHFLNKTKFVARAVVLAKKVSKQIRGADESKG